MSDRRALVASTSVETGLFASIERVIDRDELIRFVDQFAAGARQGYVEVRLPEDDFPALLVGFSQGLAVVQRMSDPESMSLLAGDGSVAGSDLVDVLIMDDLASFTGEYVLAADRARDVLMRFVDGTETGALGEWHAL